MVIYLPLEPLEERYTAQWYEWFPREFRRQAVQFVQVDSESLTNRVEVGTFLDINSTVRYKAGQIGKVAEMIHRREVHDGDVIFLADGEMFGLEGALRYLLKLNGIDAKMCAFVHAGSYTRGDFVERCQGFARHYETAWGEIFDRIFVGSIYHKRQLCAARGISGDRVEVTGNPYDVAGVRRQIGWPERVTKKLRVIHTNRPDPEKAPEKTLAVFEKLKRRHPQWECMVTTSRKRWGAGALRAYALDLDRCGVISLREGLTKREYLTFLAESRVMTGNTREENFGYCILEAMIFNTIPVVARGFSHLELVCSDERCLFSSEEEQIDKIEQALAQPFDVSQYADRHTGNLARIVELLKQGQVEVQA